ncbi:MAG TPA: zinc ribbon domain-containing protein [Desulfomonilia bacterium]
MPVYEFYCERCNTVYNFFSRRINNDRIPECPECKTIKLKKKISLFNTPSGKAKESEDGMPNIDESRLEKAMAMLGREAGSINEDDPKQAANLLRKLSDAAGLNLGPGFQEALSRLERGEDPETIEQEMGDIFEGEDPFQQTSPAGIRSQKRRPKVDETLYEL